jgi:toxin ParE1/3/4
MNRYIIAPIAKQDLKEINHYLIRFSPAAARRLKEQIKQQCQSLATFPEMGRKADNLAPGLRSFPVGDYLIFYRLGNKHIEIVRVLSGYRDLEAIFSSDD